MMNGILEVQNLMETIRVCFFPMPLLLHLRTTWLGFPLRDL